MRDDNLSPSHVGAYTELIAAAWLMKQGYEVFRNLSPVGPVDLVGIKDGQTEYFDVKVSYRNGDDQNIHAKLNDKQKALGVKCICVFEDGTCEIDIPSSGAGACEECGGEFFQGKRWERKRFCSSKCSLTSRRRRKREGVSLGDESPSLV